MSTPFTSEQIESALAGLPGWTNVGDAITKTYEFADFAAAMDFMARAAPAIDELDHHPEWTNVYNRVDARLSSHDAGGVTDRDVRLAAVLDGLVEA
ncbi:MAG: 4a-hydroxytetrahydrobiopterin dehydratase [Nocardioidaceae bacterium]|jgi:4a-hydroxytetrahydrobiopterin dehydratase|nr:4a-hydroxytetrahydrobiopterin dehydratase [Nocardioidaceae bacterium]